MHLYKYFYILSKLILLFKADIKSTDQNFSRRTYKGILIGASEIAGDIILEL